jgi:hypothetical protein
VRIAPLFRRCVAPVALGLALVFASCAKPMQNMSMPTAEPRPDPRVGLRAGWMDAAQAAWNMRLVSTTPPSADFINPSTPGDFRLINSDISFVGPYVIQGNFSGYQVWDVSNVGHPTLKTAYVCPGSQSDVSVFRNLAFVSGEANNGRVDCGTQGIADTVSHDRLRGIRIYDFTDIAHPRHITDVQTCRGSHTHTVVEDPNDTTTVYIYVSGAAPVRSPNELSGCSSLTPDRDPNSALFRIEVIRVPLAHPEQAAIVSSPRIFDDLTEAATHGDAPEDVAAAAREVAAARARGAFTVMLRGREAVVGQRTVGTLLDSIVRARQGTGAPTGADSAALRGSLQVIIDQRFAAQQTSGPRPGPSQCHDITVYPAIHLAGGACAGYGLLLDISDPAHPRRLSAAADSNFSYWHSATFNNDGTKILFSDEWGGGLAPRCRVTDKHEWGADAIFTLSRETMTFRSYYKLPAPQTSNENCVAHNGSLIPIPGRDVMAQGWYQGGISVFDWTDAAHPVEIAYFDRGPMDSTKLEGAGSWSAYWYNGYIYSSEIARGLDILELLPSGNLTQNELDAARTVHVDFMNVQDQRRIVWPPTFALARAYVDQLQRSNGLSVDRIGAVRGALRGAEGKRGQERRSALTALASQLTLEVAGSSDAAKVRMLASTVTNLANAR